MRRQTDPRGENAQANGWHQLHETCRQLLAVQAGRREDAACGKTQALASSVKQRQLPGRHALQTWDMRTLFSPTKGSDRASVVRLIRMSNKRCAAKGRRGLLQVTFFVHDPLGQEHRTEMWQVVRLSEAGFRHGHSHRRVAGTLSRLLVRKLHDTAG